MGNVGNIYPREITRKSAPKRAKSTYNHKSAIRRLGEKGRSGQFPFRPGQQRDGGSFSDGHHVPAQAERTGGGDHSGRVPVRDGQRQGGHQDQTLPGVQSAHRDPHAIKCVCTIYSYRDQYPLL